MQGQWGDSSREAVVSGNLMAALTDSGVRVTRVSDGAELWSTQSVAVYQTSDAPPGASGYLRWLLSVGSGADEKIW